MSKSPGYSDSKADQQGSQIRKLRGILREIKDQTRTLPTSYKEARQVINKVKESIKEVEREL